MWLETTGRVRATVLESVPWQLGRQDHLLLHRVPHASRGRCRCPISPSDTVENVWREAADWMVGVVGPWRKWKGKIYGDSSSITLPSLYVFSIDIALRIPERPIPPHPAVESPLIFLFLFLPQGMTHEVRGCREIVIVVREAVVAMLPDLDRNAYVTTDLE